MPSFKKYGPSHMIQLLSTTFRSSENLRTNNWLGLELPCFYESDEAIIFTPVSDVDDSHHDLESITQTLSQTPANLPRKKLIFPVVEEQRSFLDLPRNHWVTLHYDPDTEIATLIDSRPAWASFWYPTSTIHTTLMSGLSARGLVVKTFEVKYQGVQSDYMRCGAWTAVNIELLAHGKSVNELLLELTAADRDAVVEHNQHKMDTGENNGIFQPVNAIDPNSYDHCEVETSLSEQNIAQQQATWLETANILFEHTRNNPRQLLLALIARESITYQGVKLSDQILDQFSAEQILANTSIGLSTTRFQVYDPTRLGSSLREIGFDEQEINALTLSDQLKYDAIVSSAINGAGHDDFYAERIFSLESPLASQAMLSEYQRFKTVLFSSLKQQVTAILPKVEDDLPPPHSQATWSAVLFEFLAWLLEKIYDFCLLLIKRPSKLYREKVPTFFAERAVSTVEEPAFNVGLANEIN